MGKTAFSKSESLILPGGLLLVCYAGKAPSLFEPGILPEKQILEDPKRAGVIGLDGDHTAHP